MLLKEAIANRQLYLQQNVTLKDAATLLDVTQNRLKELFTRSVDYTSFYKLLYWLHPFGISERQESSKK